MITAHLESFEACWPELVAIFPRHHLELALFKDKMPLAPQESEYIRRNQSGVLFFATLRWDGKIVAYYIAQIQPGFHYGTTLTGTQDICYVVPEVRNRGLAFPLFRLVEREMRRRGVKVWYSGWKTRNPLGMDKLLPVLGFVPADTYCVKWLGD